MKKLLLALLPLTIAGCDSYYYTAGRFYDARGKNFAAVENYEKFLKDRPSDPRAAEIHVRAGELYADLHRCLEAKRHFETAAREFPLAESWSDRAKGGIMDCPDYFPIDSGRTWIYGDSVSRGKNMRLDAEVRLSSGGAGGMIQTALYAGSKQIRSEEAEYKKAHWMVLQKSGEDWAPFLRYPFRKGESWHARRDNADLFYTIVEDDARIKTVAGTFENCLKVREVNPKFKGSWKYDYYAPFVGRVATTIAGPGFENPNTELIKFSR